MLEIETLDEALARMRVLGDGDGAGEGGSDESLGSLGSRLKRCTCAWQESLEMNCFPLDLSPSSRDTARV